MRADRFISAKEYNDALASPLVVMRDAPESVDAPYFVDLAIDTLQQRFPENDFENHPFRVYTTLDMNLQRDAEAAVRIGIQETDKQWKRRAKNYGSSELPLAQAALVVLDAQSGEVKALVGGRSYSTTQLNRVLSKRQPGSSFKPFVYAAAFASALTTEGVALTPASTVEDVPTTFLFKGKSYQPADHFNEYAGPVTLRFALAHSLNVPAVKIAEMVGYDKVARTARLAGLNVDMRPTPSIALGSYEVTPLEMAGGLHGFRELWECSEDEFDP